MPLLSRPRDSVAGSEPPAARQGLCCSGSATPSIRNLAALPAGQVNVNPRTGAVAAASREDQAARPRPPVRVTFDMR